MNDFNERIANLSPEARALFEAKLRRKTATRLHTIPTLPSSGPPQAFPLSFAQQRLWFMQSLELGRGRPLSRAWRAVPRLSGRPRVAAPRLCDPICQFCRPAACINVRVNPDSPYPR